MNLIFNAEALRPPITGVGNYSYHLLSQYVEEAQFPEVHCFTGTGWQDAEAQLAFTGALKARSDLERPGVRERAIARVRKMIGAIPGAKPLYDHVMERRFERYANAIKDAVYHETNYILKPYAGPCVTTVHDLSHIRYPEFHPPNVIEWLGGNLARSLERADRVITVSNVVRDELLEHYAISGDKVHTVYEGVDANYRPRSRDETAAVLSDFGLAHKEYVLLVATLEPRKGIDVLLDAWALVPEALRRAYPLILVGSKGWRNSALVERMATFVEEGTVRHLGYVAADVLPVLFSGAAVFCYPSVYEGFGLPVLDAMHSGVPVICRAGTSMAEFAEGACMLCETGEPGELAGKLASMLESPEGRGDWAGRGLAQARKFSWRRCAAETAAIYHLACGA